MTVRSSSLPYLIHHAVKSVSRESEATIYYHRVLSEAPRQRSLYNLSRIPLEDGQF